MQRVALSRALIMRPKVLLLDEPLAALDLKLRKLMQEELRRIHHSIGGTFVYVTHDQEEAMCLANRIVVMQDGRLVQEGTARELYTHPKTRFVSTFIGEANVFKGGRKDNNVTLDIGASFFDSGRDGNIVDVVRPEAITLTDKPTGQPSSCIQLRGRISDIIFLGPHVTCRIVINEQIISVLIPSSTLAKELEIGSDVFIEWDLADNTVLVDD